MITSCVVNVLSVFLKFSGSVPSVKGCLQLGKEPLVLAMLVTCIGKRMGDIRINDFVKVTYHDSLLSTISPKKFFFLIFLFGTPDTGWLPPSVGKITSPNNTY